MNDIVNRLRIKADVIHMGERIAWGSDTSIMHEAATYIENLEKKYEELQKSFVEAQEVIYETHAIIVDTPEINMQNFSDDDVNNLNEGVTMAFNRLNSYTERETEPNMDEAITCQS